MRIDYADYDISTIIQQAKDNGMNYLDLSVLGENRKYTVNSYLLIEDVVFDIIRQIHNGVNNITQYLVDKPSELRKILHPKIVDIILKKPGNISPHQRYDLLVDNQGNFKLVEVNSETPAGLPETLNSYLFDPYVQLQNANEGMRDTISRTFKRLGHTNVDVVFSDDSVGAFHRVGEDYTNAAYLSQFRGPTSRMVNAEDIFINDYTIEAYEKKTTMIHTFYPLEWYFLDSGGQAFRNLYLKGEFDLVNGPINLINQSKAFRAWCWDNLHIVDQFMDINVFRNFIPRYSFHKRPNTISKPRLFREGVGIGKDLEGSVHQDYIDQKIFKCKTFEGVKEGYLTIGVYCNDEEPTGIYTRFCEKKITDYTAYFLPTYITHEKSDQSITDLMTGPSTWMMRG